MGYRQGTESQGCHYRVGGLKQEVGQDAPRGSPSKDYAQPCQIYEPSLMVKNRNNQTKRIKN